jgi:heme exporter protein CcmD
LNEFFAMEGNGAYVWSAYGITLGVLIWNAWSARAKLRRNLGQASLAADSEEPAPQPKVSQVEE